MMLPKLLPPSWAENAVAVLSVSPSPETHSRLRGIFSHTNWSLHEAKSLHDALEFLREHRTPVVICERKLPDGCWQDMSVELLSVPHPPNLIVTAPDADDTLWADVLNRGGYDVLARPFDPNEVTRIVSLAWRNWKDTYNRGPGRAPVPPAAFSASA